MDYKVTRGVEGGRIVSLALGIPEVDAYLRFLRYRCRPNTWINYAHDLQIFFNIVRKPVWEVTPSDVLAFIERQWGIGLHGQRDGRTSSPSSGLSAGTVKRRVTTVSGFYEYLRIANDAMSKDNPVPRGLAARGTFWADKYRSNSFRSAPMTPLVRVPRTLPRPLDAEQITRFLASLHTERDKAMILLMLLGGLRKSEVVGLTLQDIDFGQRTVAVRDGKGGQDRVVSVSEAALQTLLQYLKEERPESDSSHIFLVLKGPHTGQPLSAEALHMIVRYHRARAGTPEVRCHRLRHTCLTRLRQAGMSLESLQAQAGHKSMSSTRVYLHLCPRDLQEQYLQMSEELLALQGKGESENG